MPALSFFYLFDTLLEVIWEVPDSASKSKSKSWVFMAVRFDSALEETKSRSQFIEVG